MNEYTQQEHDMIAAASDLYEKGSSDKAIAIGLTQGDGWWRKFISQWSIRITTPEIWLPTSTISVR